MQFMRKFGKIWYSLAATDDNIIWCMRFSYWVIKATQAHTDKYTHTHMYTHTHTHTHNHTHIHTNTRARAHTHTYKRTYTDTHTHNIQYKLFSTATLLTRTRRNIKLYV